MMKKIPLILILFIAGCATNVNYNQIIYKNVKIYKKNINFENVAAMLKRFSNQKHSNIEELKSNKIKFMYSIRHKISDNYPVIPSYEEIAYVNSFLDDVIEYIEKNNITDINKTIIDSSNILITEIFREIN